MPPERKYPRSLSDLASHPNVQVPGLPSLLARFLFRQLNPDADEVDDDFVQQLEVFSKVFVFHSAKAFFFAPSDLSGVGGMRKEIIRATPSWRKGLARYDCVFITTDEAEPGFRGLQVARVKLFLSFVYHETRYECALIHWFNDVGLEPDELTGMWVVEPDMNADGTPHLSIVHIDTILRAAHLIPVYTNELIHKNHKYEATLDSFERFFVNKYADHHAHEIAF